MTKHRQAQETALTKLLELLDVPYVEPAPRHLPEDGNNIVLEPHYDIKVKDKEDPDGTRFGLPAQLALYNEFVNTAKSMCSLRDESTCQVSLTYYQHEKGKFTIMTHVRFFDNHVHRSVSIHNVVNNAKKEFDAPGHNGLLPHRIQTEKGFEIEIKVWLNATNKM
jgi:hypothetical protein